MASRLIEAAKICAARPKGMSAKQYRLFNPAGAAKLADFMAEHRAEIVAELTSRVMQDTRTHHYHTL